MAHATSEPGWWEIRGFAWSGRSAIERVEISTNGGQTWNLANLDQPVLPKALTHFRLPWNWDGKEITIMSRAVDSTGYVQPTRDELLGWRGKPLTIYHSNAIFRWQIASDGSVTSGDAA
jgi:sulfane dehydrogenase subunit SoxC